MPLTPRQVDEALDRLEPRLAKAFREAIDRATSQAEINRLVQAIEAGDAAAAYRAAGLRESMWTGVTESVRSAYIEGGMAFADSAPARVNFGFDIRNPRAERWLREESSKYVTRTAEEQREAIRVVMEAGTRRGINPRETALNISGRINRRTGRREGGIVGLTKNQAVYVENAREELSSGSRLAMQNYLGRKRRDKRFDSIVMKAIKEERALSRVDVQRITARYSDRLLQLRAEVIARTEALTAFQAGRYESVQQAIDENLVDAKNVFFVWKATSLGGRTRDSHVALDGQKKPINEPFISPMTGAKLRYPGDSGLGAPKKEFIMCRCNLQEEVDWLSE